MLEMLPWRQEEKPANAQGTGRLPLVGRGGPSRSSPGLLLWLTGLLPQRVKLTLSRHFPHFIGSPATHTKSSDSGGGCVHLQQVLVLA